MRHLQVTGMTLAVLLLLAGVVVALKVSGASRWARETDDLYRELDAGRQVSVATRVDFGELAALPGPVQRYFRRVLKDGQPVVVAARVAHRGVFNMGEREDAWKPFTSGQHVVVRRPGFVWNGRVEMLPGLPVHVHDAYLSGRGLLHAAVLGWFTVADMRGSGAIAEGEMMRFLAEAAWYPTALLPSQGVKWTGVDERSARATLVDGDISLTMLFTFDDDGLIDTVSAPSRGRAAGGKIVPTPWQGRFWNYQWRSGMLVPLSGEVSWLLPAGPKPYWRGDILNVEYEPAS